MNHQTLFFRKKFYEETPLCLRHKQINLFSVKGVSDDEKNEN